MTTFTKGPWAVGLPDAIYGGKHEQLLAISTGEAYGSYFGDDTDDVEAMRKANAHLIAAAPELYDALEAWVDPSQQNLGKLLEQTREALDKARGKQ
jgi:hypothetical protein